LVHGLILFGSDACSINPVSSAGDLIEIKLREFAAGCHLILCRLPTLMNINTKVGARHMVGERRRRQMRFYFDIRDKLAIRDEVGRDLESVSEAVVYAKYLAADLRCLEPVARPRLSIEVMSESNQRIHEEAVFA
jgi:hypothetical protein